MRAIPDLQKRTDDKRKVFILRLWEHGREEPVWIGEIQDIATGETIHTSNLEALFDWLRQKTASIQPLSTGKANKELSGSGDKNHHPKNPGS